MLNKVILIGNLGSDPELRSLPNGGGVASFRLATQEMPHNGEKVTEWHSVTVFGKQAEIVAKYLRKGRQVYVEGRIKSRKYKGRDEIERTAVEIVANQVKFLGGSDRAEAGASNDDIPWGNSNNN